MPTNASTYGVNKVHEAMNRMGLHWPLIDALRGGTYAMRKAREVYLPKRNLEDDVDYNARLCNATLYPAFSETVRTYKGRVFAEQPTVNEDVPVWIKDEIIPNFDLEGNPLHVFAADVYEQAVSYGLSHVLVESPPSKNPDGTPIRTREQQKAANLRPYAIHITPKRVIGWRVGANGKLTQLRLWFCRTEADGQFGEAEIEQIRVYEIGTGEPDAPGVASKVHVRVFEKAQGKADEWVEDTNQFQQTDLDEIPFRTYYTERCGFMEAQPPLKELAYLNAKHWSMQCSNDALIETASVPILMVSGIEGEASITIGAKSAIKLPTGADMKFVEHNGNSIKAGRESLDALKDEMKEAGAKLLVQTAAAKTATEAGEDAARENSQLGGQVTDLETFLGELLKLMAMYRNETVGGTIKLKPNLTPSFSSNDALTFLLNMRNSGALSDETLFNEAKRHNFLNEEIEWKDEQDRIASQPRDTAPVNDDLSDTDPVTGKKKKKAPTNEPAKTGEEK